MPITSCRLAGDPLGLTIREGDAAIQRDRCLCRDPRPPVPMGEQKLLICGRGLLRQQPNDDLYSRLAESLRSTSGPWIGICHRNHDPRDSSRQQRLCARPGASGVIARFERHICGRAVQVHLCISNRGDLCVRPSGKIVKPFAKNHPISNDHTTDMGVRRRESTL
jgi:hypothetical protein